MTTDERNGTAKVYDKQYHTGDMDTPSWRELHRYVVSTQLCSGCAGCIVECPYDMLTYEGEYPKQHFLPNMPEDFCLVAENRPCDFCARACPRLGDWEVDAGRMLFGLDYPSKGDEMGFYQDVVVARAKDSEVFQAGVDGGVVTGLLIWLLDQGAIDGVILSGLDEEQPWNPVPRVARTPEEIIAGAGSKYTYSANPLALLDAAAQDLHNLAFVGVPCQIEYIRKAQVTSFEDSPLKRFVDRIKLTVGLVCSEVFAFDGFMKDYIAEGLDVDLEDVRLINIKGKVLVYLKNGKVKEAPLKGAKQYSRPQCSFCGDFTAEWADIAAGGMGTMDWTILLLRTRHGKQMYREAEKAGIFETAPVHDFPKSFELLRKFSLKEKRIQMNRYEALQERSRIGPEVVTWPK